MIHFEGLKYHVTYGIRDAIHISGGKAEPPDMITYHRARGYEEADHSLMKANMT